VFVVSDKLASLLDEKKASRLTERIFDLAEELKSAQRASRKRHHESEPKQEDKEVSKKAKMKPNMEPEVTTIPAPGNPSPGQLTTLQVKTVWKLSQYAKQHPTASTRKGLNNVNELGCAELRMRFVVVINQQLEISMVMINNNQSIKAEWST
jgi:hypothetical protein